MFSENRQRAIFNLEQELRSDDFSKIHISYPTSHNALERHDKNMETKSELPLCIIRGLMNLKHLFLLLKILHVNRFLKVLWEFIELTGQSKAKKKQFEKKTTSSERTSTESYFWVTREGWEKRHTKLNSFEFQWRLGLTCFLNLGNLTS